MEPKGVDIKIEAEESDTIDGLKRVTITALNEQGEIDLAMEYPRFLKLLERNWEE